MAFYSIHYTYDAEQTELMDQVRPEHREYLSHLAHRGINVGSGPFVDVDTPGALLIFTCDTPDEVEQLLNEDPFWKNNVIVQRTITQWNPLIGAIGQLEM